MAKCNQLTPLLFRGLNIKVSDKSKSKCNIYGEKYTLLTETVKLYSTVISLHQVTWLDHTTNCFIVLVVYYELYATFTSISLLVVQIFSNVQCLRLSKAQQKTFKYCVSDTLYTLETYSDTLQTNQQDNLTVTMNLTLSPSTLLRLYTLPYWSNPPFLIFDMSAWMSKIKNGGLDQHGAGSFEFGTAGVEGVNEI